MSTFFDRVKEWFRNDPDQCAASLECAEQLLADIKTEVIQFKEHSGGFMELTWTEALKACKPMPTSALSETAKVLAKTVSVAGTAAPAAEPKAPVQKVDAEFADVFSIGDARIEKSSSPFADGTENMPDVVDTFLKSQTNQKFHIRDERRVRDPRVVKTTNSRGVVAEFGEDGHVIRTFVEKREQPVEKLFSIEEPSTENYIEEQLAKIVGIQDITPEEMPLQK
jgi:hypothetical protein